MDDKGCKALIDGLKCTTTLSKVCLAGNFIANEGCKALAELLRSNRSIAELDLSCMCPQLHLHRSWVAQSSASYDAGTRFACT
eukprot:1708311-Pleurochrysis_carterae.AAC.3